MASSAWERRNERARAEGFRNYYDKRTRKTIDAPKPTGDALRRARGHAGQSDLKRLLDSGRVEIVNVIQTGYGKTPTFDVLVILSDGTQQSFTVKGEAAATRVRRQLEGMTDGPEGIRVVGSPKGMKKFSEDAELAAEIAAYEDELEDFEPAADDGPATFSDDDIPF